MSLGSGSGKVVSMKVGHDLKNTEPEHRFAKVTEDGVAFTDPNSGQDDFIGPEESM